MSVRDIADWMVNVHDRQPADGEGWWRAMPLMPLLPLMPTAYDEEGRA